MILSAATMVSTQESDAARALAALWQHAGGDPAALARVRLSGGDPILPGRFKVGTAALATIGAAALAAAELWRIRTGRAQDVAVDARAAAASFRGERYLRVGDAPPPEPWGRLSGYYRTGDGRFVQLHCNFPHHAAGVLRVLGCEDTHEAVAAAILGWKAEALEDTLAGADMCAGLLRAPEEWRRHPQGGAVATLPLIEIVRIGDAPAMPLGAGDRPLGGLRVLDLTRVIAGPVCGRTLAAHGADVLLVTAGHLPSIPRLVIETGHGKRSAQLDLRDRDDLERLRALIGEADVFCQSYRPGALAAHGLAPEDLARLRPGIVYVTLSAYGHAGPWRDRRGFDSLVQTVSGIAWEGGRDAGLDGPRPLPAQALDHSSGYLAAFGAMVALARRAREGGSWLVRLSLAQTGRWIDALGRIDGTPAPELRLEDVEDLMLTSDTAFGRLRHVGPAATLSETPARWTRPAVPLGSDPPTWLDG
jgi:crotonobetainyl-CoA:carnitine CoA-transferase CaiB-like acyl-CoA transferase